MADPARSEDALRAVVAAKVEVTSLRAVAEEVGLTHRGLRKFLEGSKPRAGTTQKLLTWFSKQRRDPERMTPGEAEALIASLLRHVPPRKRANTMTEIVEVLERAYDGTKVPRWVTELRSRGRKTSRED